VVAFPLGPARSVVKKSSASTARSPSRLRGWMVAPTARATAGQSPLALAFASDPPSVARLPISGSLITAAARGSSGAARAMPAEYSISAEVAINGRPIELLARNLVITVHGRHQKLPPPDAASQEEEPAEDRHFTLLVSAGKWAPAHVRRGPGVTAAAGDQP
jgi:hypothetical protein